MNNIILIGMPGSGKSTLGVILAKALGYDFVDTDLLISKKYRMKLQQIIDSKGLQSFLDFEAETVSELQCDNTVIATGGSVICRERGIQSLKALGTVVYLNVSFKEIRRRVRNITTRGIAFEEGETLFDLFRKRAPLYEKYADITVNIESRSDLESTVEKIIDTLQAKKYV